MGGLAGLVPEAGADEGDDTGAGPVFPAGVAVVPDESAPKGTPSGVRMEDGAGEAPVDAAAAFDEVGAGAGPVEGVPAADAGADCANAPMAAAGLVAAAAGAE